VQTRKASLQVSHSSYCPNRNKTSLDSVDAACRKSKCKPRYFTLHRIDGPDGRPIKVKGERFTDRQTAEKVLNRLQVQIDENRAGLTPSSERNTTLREWFTRFEKIAESRVAMGSMKQRTLEGYEESMRLYALPSIGSRPLRQIARPELRAFFDATETGMDGESVSTASRLRHLRHLNVVLQAAVDEGGLLEFNPLPPFKRSLKLKAPARGKGPFEDGELHRLWAAFRAKETQRAKPWLPVYGLAAEFSVETGIRLGELVALDLDDLRGTDLEIRHTFSAGRLVAPKDGEVRTVYLTKEALDVLARWLPLRGTEPGPLFQMPDGRRLTVREPQRRLQKAMDAAGIPKVNANGLPRSWHSLRYSFSNQLQRRGYHPRFIELNLGHSTLELTLSTYGQWTPEQMRQEAARN
jgi:integrase